MALDCKHTHPLQHDGTSRNERFMEALEPGNTPIHQFDLRDWMRFACHYAARLNYFSTADAEHPDGNWQDFMKAEEEIETWLKDAALVADEKWLPKEERERIAKREPRADYEPHLALFLAFLKLMRFPQDHLNGLSKRHLDFYYQRVLQLSRKPAVPDRVHILFELARNATLETAPANTLLDGGKDSSGKPLRYATEEEITVNTATVSLLKSIYHEDGKTVRYAEMTNSRDGLGTEFKEENPSWNGFGSNTWPAATLGFALASGVLLMKEGNREIVVSLDLELTGSAEQPSEQHYQDQLEVYLSGEKEWLPASSLTVKAIAASSSLNLTFTITVDTSRQAIVPYDAKVHGERFNTNLPVLRVLVNTGSPDGYRIYSILSTSVITNAGIDITVTGARDLVIENDQGRLDPSKPFYPFGPVPQIGSGLYVGSNEIFQKEWQKVDLNITWKEKVPDLAVHYEAYLDDGLGGEPLVTGNDHFTVIPQYLKNNIWYPALDLEDGESKALFTSPLTVWREPADSVDTAQPAMPPLLMQKGVDINKAVLRNYLTTEKAAGSGKKPEISSRFEAARFNPGFAALTTVTGSFTPATKTGFIRLVLQKHFYHEQFPGILTLLMIDKAKTEPEHPTAKVPNPPYTPVIGTLTIDYQASAENIYTFTETDSAWDKYDNFAARRIQLFHEHPFGQAEQHVFLKEQCDFLDPTSARNLTLMPHYSPEGELYIGLKNAQPSGSLSLLLAAVEGSENPLAPTFAKDQSVAWSCLVNNEWQSLNRNFLVADSTNNLLRPGIVRMNLPAAVNAGNTMLDAGLFWLKASLPGGLNHSSVCRLADIHAQAATAVFRDSGNDPAHLAAPLQSGTIARIIDKPALIKGVSQPCASFGGAREENDRAYYLRVSERLRHKQRAVNIWDYERLVLERFTAIHRVKCLSHTSVSTEAGAAGYCEVAPGNVSLVVIPDLRNTNLYDPLQPRASQNLLREIEQFLAPLCGLHVGCTAVNPEYETICLDFRVKFHNRYDSNAYSKILHQDIVRYLSPWVAGDSAEIHFGGRLYKSVIIRFIEEREYVDFISRFRMYQRTGEGDINIKDRNEIVASSARAILVSAPEHKIEVLASDKVCDE